MTAHGAQTSRVFSWIEYESRVHARADHAFDGGAARGRVNAQFRKCLPTVNFTLAVRKKVLLHRYVITPSYNAFRGKGMRRVLITYFDAGWGTSRCGSGHLGSIVAVE